MELYLLRHGIAVERGTRGYADDSHRPLTPIGRKKTRKVAKALVNLGIRFDHIFTSPYVRARQTAEIVVEVLKAQRKLRSTGNLVSGASPRELVAELKHLCQDQHRVLLVGHEPDLSEFASLLISGRVDYGMELKKGGLCRLDASPLSAGRCASLQLLLTPRILTRLA